MSADLAPVIFLDPIAAGCGCAPGPCAGHQPTPPKADRRAGYRQAASLLAAVEDDEHATALAELLLACSDLCIPAAHPTAPNPQDVVRRLLGAADTIANAFLPDDEEDDEEAEVGHG